MTKQECEKKFYEEMRKFFSSLGIDCPKTYNGQMKDCPNFTAVLSIKEEMRAYNGRPRTKIK